MSVLTRNVQRDRFLIQRRVNANAQGRCVAIDLESSMKPHAGASVITMENVRPRTSSTVDTASVPAQRSSIVPMARPSAIKLVTVSASGGKTAQHPRYLTRIVASVRASISLANAQIQLKYLIQKPANVSAQRSFGAIMGRCLTRLHANANVQQIHVPNAARHTSMMTTLASASARLSHPKAAHMDKFGTVPSADVNVQRR